MLERTLAIIKPGACLRRHVGEIFEKIENCIGYQVVRAKYFQMDEAMAREFYKEHDGRPYFDGLIAHTTSGPCMAIELSGHNVIKRWRDWIGPSAGAELGTLRYLYRGPGTYGADNGLHGSDSVEAAGREIGLIFDEPARCTDPMQLIPKAAPGLDYLVHGTDHRHSIKFKRIEGVKGIAAVLPIRAKEGDSGLDLYAAEDRLIRTGQAVKVSTGWKIELPPRIEGQIRPRSGMSSKGIMACFGTIDAGYRGELMATLFNITGEDYWVKAGDKIAQLVPMPVYDLASCEVVGPLSESERGEGGFGSTGR